LIESVWPARRLGAPTAPARSTPRGGAWYGHWRDPSGRQIKRRIGLTKSQAEARLRDPIQTATATAPLEHARTLQAAADAWLTQLAATGTKASSIRAYKAALHKWFMPTLKGRSLDRITTSDIEHAMRRVLEPLSGGLRH
jgi:hypothetical protein